MIIVVYVRSRDFAQITSFIDEAAEKGDSVLVHSLEGTGRCIACVAAYLMFRHRWSFEKALDFLCNKRPDAAPNAGFVQQVSAFNKESRHNVRFCTSCVLKSSCSVSLCLGDKSSIVGHAH